MQTHRYLIEPISETNYLKNVLMERFFSFPMQIEKSTKKVPKQLLNFIKNDVRSTTGANLRNILLLTDKNYIDELRKEHLQDIKYQDVDPTNKWKIGFIKEITNVKFNQLEVENFSKEELEDILEFLCTS